MSDLGNKKIMGQNIQAYMDKKNVSRQKLSDDLGVSYTTLSDWIKGNTYPRIDKIELMANYFGIEKSDLVEDHAKMNNANKTANLLAAHIDDDASEDEISDIMNYIDFLKNKRND